MKLFTLFPQSVRASVAVLLLVSQTLPAEQLRPHTSAMDLLIQKARSLEARDRADLAAQVWQQVLVTDPNQPDALAGVARWAKRSGKNEEANGYLSKLRRVAPDAPALTQLDSPEVARQSSDRLNEAAKLAAKGQSDEAMRIYREVFGSAPPPGGWATAYYETLANTSGGFEPALAALQKLAATYPEVPNYKLAAGKLMTYRPATRQAGVTLLASIPQSTAAGAKARESWRQALVWEKTNAAFLPAIENYLANYSDPELQTAVPSLRAQTAKGGRSYESKEEQMGYAALKGGNVADAEKQFEAAVAKDEKNGRGHAGLGFVRMKAGDFDAAIDHLEVAHKAFPTDTTIKSSLESARFWQAMQKGAKASDAGEWTEAAASYGRAASLKPNSEEAAKALGGALLAAGSPAKALPYLERATKAKTLDESAWCAFVTAKLQAEGGKAALVAMNAAPDTFATPLDRNISWKALRASAFADSGEPSKGEELYRELLASTDPINLDATQQIELAGLALRYRQPEQALVYARKAVNDRANDAGASEVLFSALVGARRPQEAERFFNRMPEKLQKMVLTRPAFLEALASLKELNGDLEGARTLLEQATSISDSSVKDKGAELTKLHMAQVLAKLGRGTEAESVVTAIVEAHPNDPDAWRAHFLVLQLLHRENDIVSVASNMPQNVAVKLGTDGEMVTLLARAHGAAGDPAFGVKLLETYISRSSSPEGGATLPQRIQLGWLLLNSQGQSSRLFKVLDNLNARKDMNDDQRKEVTNLWVTWILRSSDAAHRGGNDTRAIGLLQQGMNMFPDQPELQRALAGNLLASGNTRRALNVYSNWGLNGAQADDYAGAIGAALAEKNGQYADTWIDKGLSLWPNNSKLLELAGERAKAHGDLKQAELFWRQALAEKKSQPESVLASTENAGPSLKAMLIGTEGQRKLADGNVSSSDLRATMASPGDDDAPQVHFSSFDRRATAREDVVRSNAFLGESISSSTAAQTSLLLKPVLPADSLEDKIAALESRNTPYVGSKMTVWGRGGEAGFGKLLIEQTELEASTNLSNSLRASFLLKPTFLSGGTASGTGTSLFGRQTTVGSFGPQTAAGIAPEAQLSSDSFGLRLGTTPQGFLVNNWVGGLRIQPKAGPITLLLERDSVKDTMLAFSGAKDPQSGQTWGGVMTNTAGLQGRWGDENSGFYASAAYQVLDGRNVAKNTGMNGGFGTWWKVAVLPTGSLTVGMNFSAMHYDRNLRYFTFGQGGYFSPQQYFLFNVPVRWAGTYGRRLQYTLGGSLGLQHFVEDASDYYPTDAALQAKMGYRYQALTNTGANFSFDGRLNYQMAPHWVLGAFVTASNARNYTAASAGLFVKYTFEERPMSFQNALPSTPDWRGQQPFVLF
ncbi:MAG: cellulose synthase subunit BcsC-related outer membrane protein [Bryobacteraceae bacterium]